jgi:GDPmannose 4,6-dehydratase
MKKVLILGGSGQAGYYLQLFLRHTGRGCLTVPSHKQLDFLARDFTGKLENLLWELQPDEIYNFASLMYAPDSWRSPLDYMQVNGTAVLQILNLILKVCPGARFFNAGSAEMFRKGTTVQDECTEVRPINPYGAAKQFAYEAVRIYREEKGLHASTGIFFNMESPRRQATFFTRKVVKEAVRLRMDVESGRLIIPMMLGPLSARRDWGWCPEYVEVAHKILQQDKPDDFVIGTGESNTCLNFVMTTLRAAGLPSPAMNFNKYVSCESTYHAIDCMEADPRKASARLRWNAKYKMKDVIEMLVAVEMAQCEPGLMRITGS